MRRDIAVLVRSVRREGQAIAVALEERAVPYRLVGDITADTPIGSRQIPFDQRGEFAAVRVR